MKYFKIASRLFGSTAIHMRPYFASLYDDLKKSKLSISVDEYIAGMLLAFVISLVFSIILFTSIFSMLLPVGEAIATSMTVSILSSSLVFLGFYLYPSIVVSSRKQKIDISVPYTTIYLSTLSSGNIPLLEMFRIIGNMKEYGEVSKECSQIVRNVDLLGMNVESSIMKVADETPSKKFRELLEGIYYTITSGGNLYQYPKEKADVYVADYEDVLRRYSQTLSMLNQVYLSIIIVGSVFFIILTTIMNMISPSLSSLLMQFIIVFLIMPVVSIGFILLIKFISPE